MAPSLSRHCQEERGWEEAERREVATRRGRRPALEEMEKGGGEKETNREGRRRQERRKWRLTELGALTGDQRASLAGSPGPREVLSSAVKVRE